MKNKRKKKSPVAVYDCDIQFWAGELTVRARTEPEARRKMWDRLKKNPKIMLRWINKKNSYVDKRY